jgi:glucose/arabinose dehydrogenase
MKRIMLLGLLLIGPLALAQPFSIDIELFATGLSSPVDLQNAGDERLFVVQQGGTIRILDQNGDIEPTAFLDISGNVSSGSEQGLLGLAFHPDYDSNGFFFINYTLPNGDTRISRFTVSGDPNVADPSSELVILEYDQPFANHNGGSLQFGPDGYLYISSGDGGSGGDPGNRAQNTTLLLGKLLRIDIDNTEGGNNYAIPSDNPFAGSGTDAQEIWAYGLRNPWKFSFDAETGDIWIADVGQNEVEEINRATSDAAGLNYGWRCYEGSQPFNTTGCPDPGELTFPIAEYSSDGTGNCSVTGGYVYRGTDYPDIQGIYFYADVCSGEIGTVDNEGNLVDQGSFGNSWVSFGEDVNNELYIVGIGGSIFRITGELLDTEQLESGLELEVYPNPASDQLNLRSKSPIQQLRLYDLGGNLVRSVMPNGARELSIDVQQLAAGVYFMEVMSQDNRLVTEKIIVQ